MSGCFGQDSFARRNPGLKSETWATHLKPPSIQVVDLRRSNRPTLVIPTERTGISYFALLATTTCAVFLKEIRGAQWRDLLFDRDAISDTL
jgi:hypothetical protein